MVSVPLFGSCIWGSSKHPCATIGQGENHEREREEKERGLLGSSVVESLHSIIDRNGDYAGNASDIAPDHPHHAELSDCRGEAQGHARENAWPRSWQHNMPEGTQAGNAHDVRGGPRLGAGMGCSHR
jgi:hypothetical protein